MSAPEARITQHVAAIGAALCELYPGLDLSPPIIKAGADWPLAPIVLISGEWTNPDVSGWTVPGPSPRRPHGELSPEMRAAWIAFRDQFVRVAEWSEGTETDAAQKRFDDQANIECDCAQAVLDTPATCWPDIAVKLLVSDANLGAVPGDETRTRADYSVSRYGMPTVAMYEAFALTGTAFLDWGESETWAKWRADIDAHRTAWFAHGE